MAEYYKCMDCGCTFSEDEMGCEKEWIGESNYSSNNSGWYSYGVCPNCGSDCFDEAEECCCCGELFSKENEMTSSCDCWYCRECAEEVASDFLKDWGPTDKTRDALKAYGERMRKIKAMYRK